MENPRSFLIEPSAGDDSASNGFLNPLSVLDAVSPSAALNEAILAVTGFDVIGTLVRPFAGDWQAFARFGDALRHLGDCVAALGANLQADVNVLDVAWDGRAADAAYGYFTDLAMRLSAMREVLDEAGDNYVKTATGVWEVAQQLASLIEAICDVALTTTVLTGVSGVLLETGPLDLVPAALTGLKLAELLQKLAEAETVVQSGGMIILGFAGFIQQINWRFGDLADIQLPGSAYDNPAV